MPKVKFKATEGKGGLTEYHGYRSDAKPEDVQSRANMLDLQDGETADVCEKDARRLVADFPKNFVVVKSKAKATAKPKAEAEKKP